MFVFSAQDNIKDATENKGFMTIDNLQKLSVKFD